MTLKEYKRILKRKIVDSKLLLHDDKTIFDKEFLKGLIQGYEITLKDLEKIS